MTFRSNWIKWLGVSLVGALMLLLFWGVAVEPRLVHYKVETAVVPGLPASWQNKRIALIADLQIGMWLGNEDTVKEIVDRIVEERPAAVLIAGDFVYQPTDEDKPEDVEREDTLNFMQEVNRAVALVRPLTESDIPTFAVLGNHDYGIGYPDSVKNERLAVAVRSSLQAAGVQVIDNTSVPLASKVGDDGQKTSTNAESALYIVGIGSRYADNDKPELALAQVPEGAARIALMHNPNSFAKLPANAAPLAVAGHTHGGQVRVPFLEHWSWMSLATDERVEADGWINGFGQEGNHLYVNRGIGFSSFPVRINCRPELTLFTLRNS